MHELASLLENNSKHLQSSSLTSEQALNSINRVYIPLDELRTEVEFKRLNNSLNSRMFSTIHKHRMDEVSAFDVAKEFVEFNEERIVHFGHFE